MNSITERRVIHQVKIDPKISAPKIAASTSNTLGRSVSAETPHVEAFDDGPRNLNYVQVTWMTPELAHLSPNYHTTDQRENVSTQQI
ncbi:hypothetical protein TNCV_1340501 [Trichonephila clavipes]|nr:hypothetical protein TNCV_1340501 [Trichonephila clavipes]